MNRSLIFALASLALAGCISCSLSSSSDTSKSSVPTPSNFTVTHAAGIYSYWVTFSFNQPNPSKYAYNLECKVNDGNWTHIGQYSNLQLTGEVDLGSSNHYELSKFNFRIMALESNGSYSNYSNEALFNSPLQSPFLYDLTRDPNSVTIAWNTMSNISTTVQIERAEISNGTFAYSILKSVSSPSESYLDTTIQSGKSYSYRICNIKGSTKSDYSTPKSISIP